MKKFRNVGFVYSWLKYFGEKDDIWPTFNTELPLLLVINMLDALSLIRKKIFLTYGLNRSKMLYGMEDYDSWINICKNGYFGISIPEPLLNYRIRSDSMSKKFTRQMIFLLKDIMSTYHKDVYKKYGDEVYNLIENNGPSYLWNNPSLSYPNIEFNTNSIKSIPDDQKELLKKIYNSKLGQKIIRIFFKLRLNRLF